MQRIVWRVPAWSTDDIVQWLWSWITNTLREGQNVSHFADDMLKSIFLYEKRSILFQISLKFVAKGPINSKDYGLVQHKRQTNIRTKMA